MVVKVLKLINCKREEESLQLKELKTTLKLKMKWLNLNTQNLAINTNSPLILFSETQIQTMFWIMDKLILIWDHRRRWKKIVLLQLLLKIDQITSFRRKTKWEKEQKLSKVLLIKNYGSSITKNYQVCMNLLL
jgi:hypothetical protein